VPHPANIVTAITVLGVLVIISPIMKGMSMKVHFDDYNPHDEKATDVRRSLAHLDYSPLPRVTARSFTMGVLVSMGGLMYVLVVARRREV
jgi:hypothetical protein